MSKPYSDADFSAQITEDRSWRLKEISDLKTAAVRADVNLRRVLLRALITICYAHWEGYVRFAARKYLEHVALRKLQYQNLDRQFLRNYFLPRLAALSTSKASVAARCALVDEVLNSSDRRFSRENEDLVNTKANLSFDVFSDICLVCCVPIQAFADKATFVDVFLLKRRNAVAHGEETFVGIEDLDELTNQTVAIMRAFGDALENHVYLKGYKSA
ncbi:MAG TPA: MAE_28990/MAE_18760 family HEPN-like nuclease [Edaphobacter sp.]|nr:MAE_28990/MAE_18760 family HEPN-like nuclease [Edaphobacter sp.]